MDIADTLVKIFVVSDLHVVGSDRADFVSDSLLTDNPPNPRRSPLDGLLDLISDYKITADHLVCCGDLTSRAGMDGFVHGWSKVEEVASALNATSLIYTPGNHDLDVNNENGTGNTRCCIEAPSRSPTLVPDCATRHRIGTDLFELYRPGPDITVVNLDTNGSDPSSVGGRVGVVTTSTTDELEAALKDTGFADVIVVVCHHHPHRHGDIDLDDYSELQGAAELLAMMNRHPTSRWFVVHGHKHHPRIAALEGGHTVFAAGSLASTFSGPLQCVARNQAYLLTFQTDARLGKHHPVVGRFEAWDWVATRWLPALDGFGIPHSGGFGAAATPIDLAGQVSELVASRPGTRLPAADAYAEFPALRYVSPRQLDQVLHCLDANHGIRTTQDRMTKEITEFGLAT